MFGNRISETLDFKILGEQAPMPPSLGRLRRSQFLLRAYTFKISRYALGKQTLHLFSTHGVTVLCILRLIFASNFEVA